MSDSSISGTIVAAQVDGDRTILRLSTGGNGSKREDNVVVPGRRESLAAGKVIRLSNFVRAEDGALVPGENARLKVSNPEHEQPAAAVEHNATPMTEPEAQEPAQDPAKAIIEATAKRPAGIMAFSDKNTRRAVFSRAVQVAREFAEHIRKSGQIIKIQGRDYVTVAGWSILPAFEAANCYTVAYQIGEDGTVYAEAVVEKDGEIASRGFGACSEKDRPKINDRLAMAQTRARGSALKARYSVLVTLAGYEASLADEVEDAHAARPSTQAAPKYDAQPSQKPTQQQLDFALKIFDNDKAALLREVASAGLLVFELTDVPVPILKAIVERRVNERKHRRAEAAASAAA